MQITVDDIMAMQPCREWTRERIEAIAGERDSMDLMDVLSLRQVPVEDRIWLAIHCLQEMDQRRFAIWCARRCKTDVPEIKTYIDIVERHYIFGTATSDEVAAAYPAANLAAYRAAYRAANLAAYRAAYWVADWAAYWAANWAAYWVADLLADRGAERRAQLRKLMAMITALENQT